MKSTDNVKNLIRSDLHNFSPYISARMESQSGGVLLNANESPWPVTVEMAVSGLNRYPEQQPHQLKTLLANLYQVGLDQLLIMRGSDEAIDLLIRLFCSPLQDEILIFPPTYKMYETFAKLQGVKVRKIPLIGEGFQLDMNTIKMQISDRTKLIFLPSPNNPTGNLLSKSDIFELCQLTKNQSLVIIDEAYIEFSSSNGLAQYINRYDNFLILRTLSKAFGLAGLRIGTLLAQASIINWVKKILAPYPLPVPSVEMALVKLSPQGVDEMLTQVKWVKEQRQQMASALKQFKFIQRIWSSEANFILFLSDPKLESHCLSNGYLIRGLSKVFNIPGMFRLSIGTIRENKKFIEILKSF